MGPTGLDGSQFVGYLRERERGVGDGLSSFPAHNGKTDMVTSTWKVWAWSGDQKLTLHMCI